MSDSLQPHGLQHARLPWPSPSPRVAQTHIYWVDDAIHLIFCCPLFFLPSGSFPMSWLFPSSGQSIGISASVLPMDIQGWLLLGLTGLISFLSKGLSRVFSNTIVRRHQFFGPQPSSCPDSHMTTGKNHSFHCMDLCWQSDISSF